MPREEWLGVTLKYPDDYVETTVHGVHLKRTTPINSPAHYLCTAPDGVRYEMRGGNSKRFPYRIFRNGRSVEIARSIVDGAHRIADLSSERRTA